MQDKFSFETFLDTYKSEFNEYLSSVGASVYSSSRHSEELDALYQKYPKVKDVIDMGTPHELSEEECTVLIKSSNLKNELVNQEMQEVYFKGCGDCVGYLKSLKLL